MFLVAAVMFILGSFWDWGGTKVLISDRNLPSWVFGLGSKFPEFLWSPGWPYEALSVLVPFPETSMTCDSFDVDTDVPELTDESHQTKIACVYQQLNQTAWFKNKSLIWLGQHAALCLLPSRTSNPPCSPAAHGQEGQGLHWSCTGCPWAPGNLKVCVPCPTWAVVPALAELCGSLRFENTQLVQWAALFQMLTNHWAG